MPKKRKRPRKQDRPRNHPGRSNAERSQESLPGAFARWVREQHPKADATEYEDVARTAVELKAVRIQSMWQLTELADVWFAATECGILERTATTVRPGPYSEDWRRGEPADAWGMKVAAALDETDEDHEDVREWLDLEPGERFDPDEFDPDEVTEALQ